jgi:hypothetical protein
MAQFGRHSFLLRPLLAQLANLAFVPIMPPNNTRGWLLGWFANLAQPKQWHAKKFCPSFGS